MPVDVVLDSAVIVGALAQIGPGTIRFQQVPPRSGARYADALGVFAYAKDNHFSLLLSSELVEEVVMVVGSRAELAWLFDETDAAMERVARLAHRSRGGFVAPSMGVAVPRGLMTPTRTALQTAATKDRPNMRIVVTEDEAALRIGELAPHGKPWPTKEPISFISPPRFAVMAEKVRWRMRGCPS